jgi:hypothetical protein
MCPFTIRAPHLPCFVRASFANKQNSTAEVLGLGDLSERGRTGLARCFHLLMLSSTLTVVADPNSRTKKESGERM